MGVAGVSGDSIIAILWYVCVSSVGYGGKFVGLEGSDQDGVRQDGKIKLSLFEA